MVFSLLLTERHGSLRITCITFHSRAPVCPSPLSKGLMCSSSSLLPQAHPCSFFFFSLYPCLADLRKPNLWFWNLSCQLALSERQGWMESACSVALCAENSNSFDSTQSEVRKGTDGVTFTAVTHRIRWLLQTSAFPHQQCDTKVRRTGGISVTTPRRKCQQLVRFQIKGEYFPPLPLIDQQLFPSL